MSDTDRLRWDARYREEGAIARAPSPFVVSALERWGPRPPEGARALDVAGGSGRHALWLARRGLAVTLVDISSVGLDLARDLARPGLALGALALDLEQEPLPAGPWDVIVDFHYLQRELFPVFARELAPGGLLVFAQPTRKNLERHPRPGPAHLLDDGELPRLIAGLGLEALLLEEGWLDEGRHEARLVARRPRA